MGTVLHWKGNWSRAWADSVYSLDQHQAAGYGPDEQAMGAGSWTLRSQHPLQKEPWRCSGEQTGAKSMDRSDVVTEMVYPSSYSLSSGV